jgi:RNA recognition motif-containing protein
MSKVGRVKSVTVGITRRTGQSKGYGFVEFESRQDAEVAFEKYQGLDIEGRRLRIDWDLGIEKKMKTPRFRAARARNRSLRSPSFSPRRRYSPRRRSPSRSRSPRRRSPSFRSSKRSSRSPKRSRHYR